LVSSVGADLEERFAEVVGYRVGDCQDLGAGSGVDGAVAADLNGVRTVAPAYRSSMTASGTTRRRWYRIALNHNGSAPAREFLHRRLAECSAT